MLERVTQGVRSLARTWKALDRETGQRLDWEYGLRDKATLQKMVDRLAQRDVHLYGTDTWATSASVMGASGTALGAANASPFLSPRRKICMLRLYSPTVTWSLSWARSVSPIPDTFLTDNSVTYKGL